VTAPILLLDFDDVLAETRMHRITALRWALVREGMELTEETYDSHCAGLSFPAAARSLLRSTGAADETAIDLIALRADREFGAVAARGLALAPGAREFVRDAVAVARMGLVTRAARRDVQLVLDFAELADAFECVVTREDYTGPEPSPEPYNVALRRMASRSSVGLGDRAALVASLNAVAAARAARLQPIVVGPVSPSLAFAGDGYLATLEGVNVRDVFRLATGARAR
jgi:beta-phosphoglucomutase-like phosphatase (HAD superfamily)